MSETQTKSGPGIKTILAQKGLDSNDGKWQKALSQITSRDVEKALSTQQARYSTERILALISPAAENYLEKMAQIAHNLTIQRFGKTIRLYAPLYLSNFCENSCLYCGFNKNNPTERRRLTIEQAVAEADIIASEGFTDILLVSSEDREFITVDYLCALAKRLREKFSSISIEIYPLASANTDSFSIRASRLSPCIRKHTIEKFTLTFTPQAQNPITTTGSTPRTASHEQECDRLASAPCWASTISGSKPSHSLNTPII